LQRVIAAIGQPAEERSQCHEFELTKFMSTDGM
jgi:hypothetical protein